jgi:AcrR family transcriptional regulator
MRIPQDGRRYDHRMPKLSGELWAVRRRHVLESAFRCFSRNGFHATTINDVVAESGWSSSVVYRYVRTKDELIAAAIDETLAQFSALIEGLLTRDPVPTPRQTVDAVVRHLERDEREYDLRSLVIQTWAEALRRPELGMQARHALTDGRRRLTTLAERWKELGHLPEHVRAPDAAAMLLVMTLGVVVDQTHLGGEATQDALGMWLFDA